MFSRRTLEKIIFLFAFLTDARLLYVKSTNVSLWVLERSKKSSSGKRPIGTSLNSCHVSVSTTLRSYHSSAVPVMYLVPSHYSTLRPFHRIFLGTLFLKSEATYFVRSILDAFWEVAYHSVYSTMLLLNFNASIVFSFLVEQDRPCLVPLYAPNIQEPSLTQVWESVRFKY